MWNFKYFVLLLYSEQVPEYNLYKPSHTMRWKIIGQFKTVKLVKPIKSLFNR